MTADSNTASIVQAIGELVAAIDRQTEALNRAVRGDDELSIEERALITLSRHPGELDSLAQLARKMNLSSSYFYADNERNAKVRAMFESLQASVVHRGFRTTEGVEAIETPAHSE